MRQISAVFFISAEKLDRGHVAVGLGIGRCGVNKDCIGCGNGMAAGLRGIGYEGADSG